MEIRIHGGDGEIGGNCVELEHDGQRLLLDLGRPLSAGRNDDVPLPPVPGLADGADPSLLGVILSHSHQDHWGLMPAVHPTVPRWIGRGAADVLRAAEFWGTGIDLHETGHLQHQVPLTIGPFTVTPYLADHSAFDAYSLLIEADQRRVFYTGDFRGHGRKGQLFEELLADGPGDIDTLICEGTSLGRAADSEPTATEADVEAAMAETFRSTDGLVAVLSSPQNIDRLVTTYRACLRSGRELVLDLYGSDVAAATGRDTIPQLGGAWPKVHVSLTQRQRVRVKESGEFERASRVKQHRLFGEQLAADPCRFVFFGAFSSEIPRLLREDGPGLGAVVWSMWDGYLAEPSGEKLVERLAVAGVPLVHHHTSGHAPPEDLRRLIKAMRPHRIIPIHTEHPEELAAMAPEPLVDVTF